MTTHTYINAYCIISSRCDDNERTEGWDGMGWHGMGCHGMPWKEVECIYQEGAANGRIDRVMMSHSRQKKKEEKNRKKKKEKKRNKTELQWDGCLCVRKH